MIDILRNILAVSGTFIVISTATILIIQIILGIVTKKPKLNKAESFIIYTVGIIVAISMAPFYYLPA